MKNFEIEDAKEFLNELFLNEKYDSFYLFEAKADTYISYQINGKINRDFLDDDEIEQIGDEEYICWRDVKKNILEYIKGDRLPKKLKIILMFNTDNIRKLIEMHNIPIHPDNIRALFMNIYYENDKLIITSGTSLNVFTMDKTLENIWDETIEKYYSISTH